MLKVVLFLVLFNSESGEVLRSRAVAFETMDQCEAALTEERKANSDGLAIDGVCLIPSIRKPD